MAAIRAEKPLRDMALVIKPATIPGGQAWIIETIGHGEFVGSVASNPDSQLLAMAGQEGTIGGLFGTGFPGGLP